MEVSHFPKSGEITLFLETGTSCLSLVCMLESVRTHEGDRGNRDVVLDKTPV